MVKYCLWDNLYSYYDINSRYFHCPLVDILCIFSNCRKLHYFISSMVCMDMAETKHHY